MRILDILKSLFIIEPKSATEFIQKFIKDSKISRVQLEIIINSEILIQVDSLKFTASWFSVFNINKLNFENGYVIFFILDKKEIEKNKKYKFYKKSNISLMELDEMYDDEPIRTFAKFIKKTDDAIYLGKEIKAILEVIYPETKQNPQAMFNLRYINPK